MTSLLFLQSHSFLLLKDHDNGFPQGALLRLCRGNRYQPHSHSAPYFPRAITLPPENVAPLTEDECWLLDSIPRKDRHSRYMVPGFLKWACGLKVGDTVMGKVQPIDESEDEDLYARAVVRWIGRMKSFDGCFRRLFGLEIVVSCGATLLYYNYIIDRTMLRGASSQGIISSMTQTFIIFSC